MDDQSQSQIKALINSLGQGFLVFDEQGICGPLYSEACIDLLETDPAGKHVADILQIPDDKRAGFLGWLELIFSNVMDFEDLAPLGPKFFPSTLGRSIELEFKPVLDKKNQVTSVAILATDKTDQIETTEEALRKQNYAEMILRISRDRNAFFLFVKKVRELIQIFASYSQTENKASLTEIRRLLHTIKGGAGSFYIMNMRNIAHKFETEITDLLNSSTQVATEVLSSQIENYGITLELELANILTEHRSLLGEDFEKEGYVRKIGYNDLLAFSKELQKLPEGNAISLNFLKTLVAIPVSQTFLQFNSIVQQTANNLDKKVKPIQFSGEDAKILPEIYENFFASVIHIFTNAVVHGLESPAERSALGKNVNGTIRVTVTLKKNSKTAPDPDRLLILISDDGRGINPEVIRHKLFQMDDRETSPHNSDEDIIQHIFDEGLSTRESVNELSGRGVGLTALKEEVLKMQGSIRVRSTVGKRTEFEIELPYLWSAQHL